MGVPFLDTSVILCSFNPYEIHKTKATGFVNNHHLISPIVYNEIKRIQKRRFTIYASILNLLQSLEQGGANNLTFDDVHKRCFKFNYGMNTNDSGHLDGIFDKVLLELSLDKTTKLTSQLLTDFAIKISKIFNEIRFGALRIILFLDNPLNYQSRVVVPNVGKKFNKLHRFFKKIRGYPQHKNDVDILIHGVEHSCHTSTYLDIISNDKWQVSIENDVKKYSSRIFNKLFFDIYLLSAI